MLLKILACVWIVIGVLSLIWPQFMRKRVAKKGIKAVKRFLFLIGFMVSATLMSLAFDLKGLLPKTIAFVVIIVMFSGIFRLKAKAGQKIVDWLTKQSLSAFRAAGAAYLAIGLIILLFLK